MKISFDFDHTISKDFYQALAAKYIANGDDVWIVTSRFTNDHPLNRFNHNDKVFAVAQKLEIPRENIIFTNMEPKWEFLKEEQFDLHYDDDEVEIQGIEDNIPFCIGILIK